MTEETAYELETKSDLIAKLVELEKTRDVRERIDSEYDGWNHAVLTTTGLEQRLAAAHIASLLVNEFDTGEKTTDNIKELAQWILTGTTLLGSGVREIKLGVVRYLGGQLIHRVQDGKLDSKETFAVFSDLLDRIESGELDNQKLEA